jgi:hypothetical protein
MQALANDRFFVAWPGQVPAIKRGGKIGQALGRVKADLAWRKAAFLRPLDRTASYNERSIGFAPQEEAFSCGPQSH